jgi:hypothetical protein
MMHMLLLPGKSGEAWELFRKHYSLGNEVMFDRTLLVLSHI